MGPTNEEFRVVWRWLNEDILMPRCAILLLLVIAAVLLLLDYAPRPVGL